MSNEQPLPTDLELTALDPVFRELKVGRKRLFI